MMHLVKVVKIVQITIDRGLVSVIFPVTKLRFVTGNSPQTTAVTSHF